MEAWLQQAGCQLGYEGICPLLPESKFPTALCTWFHSTLSLALVATSLSAE